MYNSLGEYNQAKEIYEKALMIMKKIFGENHADVATSYENLAFVYSNLGEYNQAKDHAYAATSDNHLASLPGI